MIRIIAKPHLPEGEVRCVIIGEKYRNYLEIPLIMHNINVICAENNPYVDERLSGHIDLSSMHLGGNRLVSVEHLENSEFFHKTKVNGFEHKFTERPLESCYPHDAALNSCILGDYVICNPKTAYTDLFKDKTIIKCNQGYTKCSICVVDEHSIITSDRMIAENSAQYGIESLLINDSFVKLQGFDKGFIGGASFRISRNKIAFTGIIECADTKNRIESFLLNRGIEAVYLTNEAIFDIGSAIPIIEEI